MALALLALLATAVPPVAADITIKPGAKRRFLLKEATPEEHNRCANKIESQLEEFVRKHYNGGADEMLQKFDSNNDGISQPEELNKAMSQCYIPQDCMLGHGIVMEESPSHNEL